MVFNDHFRKEHLFSVGTYFNNDIVFHFLNNLGNRDPAVSVSLRVCQINKLSKPIVATVCRYG